MPAFLPALLLAPLTAGVVLEVSPSGPYTQIQDAVDAANDGDLVLVHAGAYGAFTVEAKSLTVVADTNELVTVTGSANVLDLTAGQTVALIGLHVHGDPVFDPTTLYPLSIDGDQGSVRCEGCEFIAAPFYQPGAWIGSSSDVSFVGCQLQGCISGDVGGCGAQAVASTLSFFDCTVQGGDGLPSDMAATYGGNGGPGLNADGCTIFSSGSTFRGGNGGYGQFYPYGITQPGPGDGGPGVVLVPGCLMRFLDTLMVGGEFGDPDYPSWDGPPAIGGTFTAIPGAKRTMTVSNPARELTSLNFSLHGAVGESVYLLVGKNTGVQWEPMNKANFLVAPPWYRTLYVGTTNGSGNLNVSLPLSDLGGGVQFQMFYLQPLFVGPGGAQQLGTPITLAALDQAF